MKIPEPLFAVINTIVRALLKSPLHRLMSDSFLVMYYTGRKSGKSFRTPVRYMRVDGGVRVFTANHTQWWRNIAANPNVDLLIAGKTSPHLATVHRDDPDSNREMLIEFLTLYPQDAVYQDIKLNSDGSLNEDDLKVAAEKSIIVSFQKQ